MLDRSTVMPGLVPGIHDLRCWRKKVVDGRDKPGHDGVENGVMIVKTP